MNGAIKMGTKGAKGNGFISGYCRHGKFNLAAEDLGAKAGKFRDKTPDNIWSWIEYDARKKEISSQKNQKGGVVDFVGRSRTSE